MLPRPIMRRGLVALSVVVHLAAGLLATVAHDHGSCCTGRQHARATALAAEDSTSARPQPRSCRHSHCHRAHRADHNREEGRHPHTAPDGWHSNSTPDTSLSTHCLACEFLAGAIAVLPWTPTVGCTAARWHDTSLSRPLDRAAFARAFLARGPPVDALPASATALFPIHTHAQSGITSHVQRFIHLYAQPPPRLRPPPGVYARRAARHDRDHRHPGRALAA